MNDEMLYKEMYSELIAYRRANQITPHTTTATVHIHHVIPRCIGGTDVSKNLVCLTFAEHMLAHYILYMFYTCRQDFKKAQLMLGAVEVLLKASKRSYGFLDIIRFGCKWFKEHCPTLKIDFFLPTDKNIELYVKKADDKFHWMTVNITALCIMPTCRTYFETSRGWRFTMSPKMAKRHLGTFQHLDFTAKYHAQFKVVNGHPCCCKLLNDEDYKKFCILANRQRKLLNAGYATSNIYLA